MSSETLSQDEIDDLIGRTNNIGPVIMANLTSLVTPQVVSTEKTMLKRYYYTLTHCGYEEQRVAKENLRQAAFKLWLNNYGFLDKYDFIDFINNEVKKRGLNWKLCIR
jgi:DNA-binding PadR family transcriptional regulator